MGDGGFVAPVRLLAIGPVADLALTKTDSPDPVTAGNNLTYTITVINNGPNPATDVTVTDTLPAEVTFVAATPSQGSCSGTSTVTCNLGTLASGATATITIVVTPKRAGTITNTVSVMGNETDPNSANNTATAATRVNDGGGGITVTVPNGGEIWPVGSTQTIRWTSSGVSAKVRIELSRDGGVSWKTLFKGTPNDGAQDWKVKGPATTQARIRVRSKKTPSISDMSDGNFTIR